MHFSITQHLIGILLYKYDYIRCNQIIFVRVQCNGNLEMQHICDSNSSGVYYHFSFGFNVALTETVVLATVRALPAEEDPRCTPL